MNAGQLHELITFQAKTNVSDGGGGYTTTWADSFNDRAKIKPLMLEESLLQEQQQQKTKYEIIVRYRDTITRNMRIVWGSKTLTIITDPINFDERYRWLKLIVKQE